MAEVFAGFVSGFFLSLLTAPVLAFVLLRMRASNSVLERALPQGVNPIAVTVVLQVGLVFFWTGIGVVFGLILLAMKGLGESVPGLLNPPYTLLVLSFFIAITGPLTILITAWWREILLGAVISFFMFGLLMPWLAEWSKFDGTPEEPNRPYLAPTNVLAQPESEAIMFISEPAVAALVTVPLSRYNP